MVTASAGIKWAGRRPMGEPGASPRSQAAVIGSEEAEKDGESLQRSVSVMMKRPKASLFFKKNKDVREDGNADPARAVVLNDTTVIISHARPASEQPLPFSTENGSDFSIQGSIKQTSAIRRKYKGRKRAAKNEQEATFEA